MKFKNIEDFIADTIEIKSFSSFCSWFFYFASLCKQFNCFPLPFLAKYLTNNEASHQPEKKIQKNKTISRKQIILFGYN